MAILYVWSGAAGSGSGADWTNAKITLTAAFLTEAAGDTLYVAHDHAESTAGAITLTSGGTPGTPTKVVCVNRAGTVPPVPADRRTTAEVITTGTSGITFNGVTHYDGIIFNAGTGTGANPWIVIASIQGTSLRFDNCSLRIINTSNSFSAAIIIGSSSIGGVHCILNNTTVSFGHVNNSILCYGMLKWYNTPSAIVGANIPSALFTLTSGRGSNVECIGVDLSASGSGKVIVSSTQAQAAQFRFIDCKLDASVTKVTASVNLGGVDSDFIRSGASGVNYNVFRSRANGTLEQETTIVRTGGASDGTTPIAWKIVTTTASFSVYFECPTIAIWNDTTGSAVTATVEGIAATLPTDAEVWLDVEYLGDASSPLASFVNDGKPDLITTAANQTSSSETWGGSTAEFKLAVTFTPQQAGWVYCRVRIGKASATIYIDPLVTLT